MMDPVSVNIVPMMLEGFPIHYHDDVMHGNAFRFSGHLRRDSPTNVPVTRGYVVNMIKLPKKQSIQLPVI